MSKKNYERIALACQGGGSLGAYHIGVTKALEESDYIPDTIAGISIGAFTAAILAGTDPQRRVEKLKDFWTTISWPESPVLPFMNDEMRKQYNEFSSLQGFLFGQPHFFTPRWLEAGGSEPLTSYYDTDRLQETLCDFIDFDGINFGRKSRLILGATRVKDGQLVFFDSAKMILGPEHVMASGAMPPGFPGVRIDGDLYWDGGCTSNTPLEGILDSTPPLDTLCFMIDLFGASGREPQTMDEVSLMIKELQYSSRTSHHIEHVRHRQNLAHALYHALKMIPESLKEDPIFKELQADASNVTFDIVHLTYKKPSFEIPSSDCEFSRSSIEDRALHGYNDMKEALQASPWLEERSHRIGTKVHRF